ncbi:unnamed protein product, partial [Cyprideis torosa]
MSSSDEDIAETVNLVIRQTRKDLQTRRTGRIGLFPFEPRLSKQELQRRRADAQNESEGGRAAAADGGRAAAEGGEAAEEEGGAAASLTGTAGDSARYEAAEQESFGCRCGWCVDDEHHCCRDEEESRKLEQEGCILENDFFRGALENKLSLDVLVKTIAEHEPDPEPLEESNKRFRFGAYRMAAGILWGYMGRGNRRPLPSCVQAYVRSLYPDPRGEYEIRKLIPQPCVLQNAEFPPEKILGVDGNWYKKIHYVQVSNDSPPSAPAVDTLPQASEIDSNVDVQTTPKSDLRSAFARPPTPYAQRTIVTSTPKKFFLSRSMDPSLSVAPFPSTPQRTKFQLPLRQVVADVTPEHVELNLGVSFCLSDESTIMSTPDANDETFVPSETDEDRESTLESVDDAENLDQPSVAGGQFIPRYILVDRNRLISTVKSCMCPVRQCVAPTDSVEEQNDFAGASTVFKCVCTSGHVWHWCSTDTVGKFKRVNLDLATAVVVCGGEPFQHTEQTVFTTEDGKIVTETGTLLEDVSQTRKDLQTRRTGRIGLFPFEPRLSKQELQGRRADAQNESEGGRAAAADGGRAAAEGGEAAEEEGGAAASLTGTAGDSARYEAAEQESFGCRCGWCVDDEHHCCRDEEESRKLEQKGCILENDFFRGALENKLSLGVLVKTIAEHEPDPEPLEETNKRFRFGAYRMAAGILWGYMGRGNRRPLPSCVQAYIRSLYPDPQGEYEIRKLIPQPYVMQNAEFPPEKILGVDGNWYKKIHYVQVSNDSPPSLPAVGTLPQEPEIASNVYVRTTPKSDVRSTFTHPPRPYAQRTIVTSTPKKLFPCRSMDPSLSVAPFPSTPQRTTSKLPLRQVVANVTPEHVELNLGVSFCVSDESTIMSTPDANDETFVPSETDEDPESTLQSVDDNENLDQSSVTSGHFLPRYILVDRNRLICTLKSCMCPVRQCVA